MYIYTVHIHMHILVYKLYLDYIKICILCNHIIITNKYACTHFYTHKAKHSLTQHTHTYTHINICILNCTVTYIHTHSYSHTYVLHLHSLLTHAHIRTDSHAHTHAHTCTHTCTHTHK